MCRRTIGCVPGADEVPCDRARVSPERNALLGHVARRVAEVPGDRVRVVIDGVMVPAKTSFADELAQVLVAQGRVVVRASADGFHHNREHRRRRGRDAWEGFWLDAFDYEHLHTQLLGPLRRGPQARGLKRSRLGLVRLTIAFRSSIGRRLPWSQRP